MLNKISDSDSDSIKTLSGINIYILNTIVKS